MDMTIRPSLNALGRTRLTSASKVDDRVLAGLALATLQIDDGDFASAQGTLLQTLNDLAMYGARISVHASDMVSATRTSLDRRRYQTCVMASCLEIIQALHVNPRSTSVGERIGRLQHSLAELRAAAATTERMAA